MAPSAVETTTNPVSETPKVKLYSGHVEGAYKELSPTSYIRESEEKGIDGHAAAKYPNYLPTWNTDQVYPPLEPFEHYEHGKDADPSFSNLLTSDSKVSHLTPTIGTEVEGVQLSSLSDAGKDELARYVAERKVVAFRNQDFADLPISEALKFGGYFGRHHIHPTSGSPEGHPEIHLVHRSAGDKSYEDFFKTRVSSVAWHSDITYEQQPPGTTFLYVLDNPDTGGDTLFANTVEAYNRLSPTFQKLLHGLKATHSGIEQVNASVKKGSIKRREPVVNEHPIVRTHPVTGEKSLYVNPQFTRSIVGLKKEESDAILNFLFEHIAWGADFHARVKWAKGTVVVWDNRSVQHTAILDWHSGQRRHLARITPQAERPYETPFES
ncbi:unnamed protein product [Fusarium graminearum]|uniref:Chromosome 1, complete genome n=2 Tax=Fusarium sambucinum species complex TaxID=569360 RepID=I1RDG5_GIBZE|nr:hypothetical protein FGSG_01661 [Fusarium graminearum PH-1]EYB22723.1 hypothetical protein FG05_01661 [Fusarium graminearum]KAF5229782.1 hypothetical protein FAUST_10210 [Fusarium austroamericanum]ESU07001.1 hypothetical protein FGSG_01661 [Fusarium graminearum PH-1]KAI6764628.1 hypothetical protein HG531_012515 [Fusarium graminearum]CAF3477589.1 unnamed protein product [Fusarium graminearum]|eukprot:XP_011317486.1 hypothetical protein FGSG_01661 [Fusarium graminearum PH-1]